MASVFSGLVNGGGFQEYGRLLDDGQELLGLDIQGAGDADDGKELDFPFSCRKDWGPPCRDRVIMGHVCCENETREDVLVSASRGDRGWLMFPCLVDGW